MSNGGDYMYLGLSISPIGAVIGGTITGLIALVLYSKIKG
ncbi:Protein of unknown function [Bacillus cytotoxicus]|uniref:Uncharacterized protein n=1 Tax=Bacillus cytotoxicus TaxID=580165 RepID=A0AAX2CP30_9BACI|nr:Protein of unknown function [Bacillus cytotoxicus]